MRLGRPVRVELGADPRRPRGETYGVEVFDARIPDAADYPEAIAHRLPITHYKPRSAAAKAAMALAGEVLERMARSAADQIVEAA